ncbi:MAG: zinc-ribbon domain-containing protein, partial [Anaerolineae bacterium]
MKCPDCGADNREGARFCRGCGAQLLEKEALPDSNAKEIVPEGEPDLVGSPDVAPDLSAASPGGQVPQQEEQAAADAPEGEGDSAGEEAPTPESGDEPIPSEPEGQEIPTATAAGLDDAGYEPLAEEDDDLLMFWREEAEPMTPVEQDTVVGDRYAIEEALDVQADEILYKALDLWRCWQ